MIRPSAPTRALQPASSICAFCTHHLSSKRLPLSIRQRRSISHAYLRKTKEAKESWDKNAIEIKEGRQESMLTMLEKRGYINAIAGDRDGLDNLMTKKRVGIYAGFDPTAASLHVGHLLPLMVLFWFYVKGFSATALLGTATASIGDPTGRTESRRKMDSEERKLNTVSVHYQLKRIWQLCENHSKNYGHQWEWAWRRALLNNNHWLNKLEILEVLKLLGHGVRIGTMLGRDTVKTRLESGAGMSFSEFCYPLLQAWDWWHLYHTNGIQLQVGGSDQYGNIIAGMDAINHINKNHYNPIHRVKQNEESFAKPMGFTVPLLTTSSGEKFGKSAGNAVWLDKEQTSCFDLYQYFLRTPDTDVERYLKLFTFLPLTDVSSLVTTHMEAPHKRVAQHKLAYEVLCLVHGDKDARTARDQHAAVFEKASVSTLLGSATSSSPSSTYEPAHPKNYGPLPGPSGSHTPPKSLPTDISSSLNIHAPQSNAFNTPLSHTVLPISLVKDMPIARVLYSAGLVTSRSEGHRLILKRGAYVANRPDRKKGGMPDQVDYVPIDNWKPEETMSYMIPSSSEEPTATENADDKPIGSFIFRIGKWKVRIVRIIPDSLFIKQGLTCPGWSPPPSTSVSSVSTTIAPKNSLGKLPPPPKPDPALLEAERQAQSTRDSETAFAQKRRQDWLGQPIEEKASLRTPEARREERMRKKQASREAITNKNERQAEKRKTLRPGKELRREERRVERKMRGFRAAERRLKEEGGPQAWDDDEEEDDDDDDSVDEEGYGHRGKSGRIRKEDTWKGRGRVAMRRDRNSIMDARVPPLSSGRAPPRSVGEMMRRSSGRGIGGGKRGGGRSIG